MKTGVFKPEDEGNIDKAMILWTPIGVLFDLQNSTDTEIIGNKHLWNVINLDPDKEAIEMPGNKTVFFVPSRFELQHVYEYKFGSAVLYSLNPVNIIKRIASKFFVLAIIVTTIPAYSSDDAELMKLIKEEQRLLQLEVKNQNKDKELGIVKNKIPKAPEVVPAKTVETTNLKKKQIIEYQKKQWKKYKKESELDRGLNWSRPFISEEDFTKVVKDEMSAVKDVLNPKKQKFIVPFKDPVKKQEVKPISQRKINLKLFEPSNLIEITGPTF